MTVLYLDTEFNGHGGALISMALVSPEGYRWYEAKDVSGKTDRWVKAHVIPVLDTEPLPEDIFKRHFHGFIQQFRSPLIVCDWHADASHFCDMLAGRDYGSSLDFQCNISILKTPPGQPVSARPHNALADAIALMRWHTAMENAA